MRHCPIILTSIEKISDVLPPLGAIKQSAKVRLMDAAYHVWRMWKGLRRKYGSAITPRTTYVALNIVELRDLISTRIK